MKTPKTLIAALAIASAASFAGCKEDVIDINDYNEYVKNFITQFGIPDQNHSYNMAVRGTVTVKSTTPRDVQVVAEVNGKTYLFADYYAVVGTSPINFDIPQGTEQVFVVSDGMMWPCRLGGTVDLDKAAAVVAKAKSRTDEPTTLTYTASSNGWCTPENLDFVGFNTWYNIRFSGWELQHYLDEFSDKSKKRTDHERLYKIGYGDTQVGVAYWKKAETTQFELGFYDITDNVLIPFYRTADIDFTSANNTISKNYVWEQNRSDENAMNLRGVAITIDFDAKSQEIEIGDWNRDNDLQHFFFPNFYEDASLIPLLADHAAYQAHMPVYTDYQDGYKDINSYGISLPRYDSENPLNFYGQWDKFVYGLINSDPSYADYRSHYNEFTCIKESFTAQGMVFSTGHSYPTKVERIGEGNKFKITFDNAISPDHSVAPPTSSTALISTIEGNERFDVAVARLFRDEPAHPADKDDQLHQYTIYYRDTNGRFKTMLKDGESDLDPNHEYLKTYSFSRYTCNDGHTATNQGVLAIDVDGDGDYTDLILTSNGGAVSPDSHTFEPYEWIIACEDLGNTDDWDFNDLVVAISTASTNASQQTIKVRPLAAGGIYPLYLMHTENYRTELIGTEIHKWLGVSLDIYNTGEVYDTRVDKIPSISYTYDITWNGQEFSMANLKDAQWEGGNMGGFWVLVDKQNRYDEIVSSEMNIKEFNRINDDFTNWPELNKINTSVNRENGNVPMMICVGGEWEWPSERKNIKAAYPSFVDWVGTPSTIWYGENETKAHDPNLVTKKNN